MMRIRVTNPNVMRALRRHDRGAAKPYNFALSPILVQPPPEFTLVAPFSKHPENWLAREYTEIHSGHAVKLLRDYNGQRIVPQTLSSVIWRHYLHPEDKSLSPDGKRCGPYTIGLLLRRPIRAMTPPSFIGKEIERKTQEGEDISMLEGEGPVKYQPRQRLNTRAADQRLILRLRSLLEAGVSQGKFRRTSQVSQHAFERFLNGERVHPNTRTAIARAIEILEKGIRKRAPTTIGTDSIL